ncbi:MAG: VOC family protein [Candidatus Aenigmarchaeota archaeon]|nr:VOC family protein [Candidatus Aenigmarchaeota archaeon]
MAKTACIGHVHIKVSDLKKAEKFYAETLGLKVTERVHGKYVFLTFGEKHHDVALQQVDDAIKQPGNSVGLYHFAIELDSSKGLAEIYKKLKDASVPMTPIDHGISKVIYFSDPDGNGIEVYIDTRHVRKFWKGISEPLDMEKSASHPKN